MRRWKSNSTMKVYEGLCNTESTKECGNGSSTILWLSIFILLQQLWLYSCVAIGRSVFLWASISYVQSFYASKQQHLYIKTERLCNKNMRSIVHSFLIIISGRVRKMKGWTSTNTERLTSVKLSALTKLTRSTNSI